MIEKLKGMLTQKMVIIILTGVLILVGVGALLAGTGGSSSFDTAGNYEKARTGGDLPQSAPALPKCASNIEMKKTEEAITSIAFDCADEKEKAAFVALIRSGFAWNLFVDKNRITLEAVTKE